jgi:hypothetical protein
MCRPKALPLCPVSLSLTRIDGEKEREEEENFCVLFSNLGVSPARECNFGVDLLAVELVRG